MSVMSEANLNTHRFDADIDRCLELCVVLICVLKFSDSVDGLCSFDAYTFCHGPVLRFACVCVPIDDALEKRLHICDSSGTRLACEKTTE